VSLASPYLDRAREELWSRDVFSFIPDRDLPEPVDVVAQGGGPAVVFTGFPSDYSLGFLLGLLQLDVRVVGIVTSPGAHPAILGDNALSRIASHLDVPLLRAWRINDEHSRMSLAALQADAVVMASFDQIVGARALEIPRHGWMNIHPSLLPAYRGPEPVYWAIADGAVETGITLHRAVARVDAGPILAQKAMAIRADDTSGSLTKRLVATGVDLLPSALQGLLANAPGTPPDLSRSSYRSSVGHRSLSEATSAVEAERMVRAGYPNMLAWTVIDGHPVYVEGARILADGKRSENPGLQYPDGELELVAIAPTCRCHHDVTDCPHRETQVANA
jgi:methionyl-tRNA formyltransferase